MPSLMPNGKQAYHDSNGNPLSGGRVYTFEAGTSTPLETYSDAEGLTPNTNPVVLNARGEALIFWGDAPYKVVVKDAADVEIYTADSLQASVGRADLASNASAELGAGMVGIHDANGDYAAATAEGAFAEIAQSFKSKTSRTVDSVAALRTLDKTKFTRAFVTGYYTSGDGGGGAFWYDSTDTTSADNGGTIIVAADGARWKRIYSGALTVRWFGAKGDGTTDDAAAFQLAGAAASGRRLLIPPGTYKIVGGFDVVGANTHVIGYGATLDYRQTASYNHCIRVFGDDCSVEGVKITSPAGLVRNDTGFGISFGRVATATKNNAARNCTIDGVASAGIWFSNVTDAKAIGNAVRNCLADGIHFSDGCSRIVAEANVLDGNGDDQIAVVNDTVGAPLVGSFVVAGNIIQGGTQVGVAAGHGIALIGAVGGVVSGNTITGTPEPGIGTYQFSDPTNPADAISIVGNTLVNTGNGNVFGGCGINLQQTADVSIKGNHITGLAYDGAKTTGAIRITSAGQADISQNFIYDNACDGIVTSGGTTLTIANNSFGFGTRTAVLATGAATTCVVAGNVFIGSSATNDIDVNLPSAAVTVFGNRCGKAVSVVGSTVSISREEMQTFTPTVTAQTGTITTASAAMTYQRRGKFTFVTVSVSITTNGTGAGAVVLSLPFSVNGGDLSGRENALTGNQLNGVASGTSLTIRTASNGYPGGSGASMTLSGVVVMP